MTQEHARSAAGLPKSEIRVFVSIPIYVHAMAITVLAGFLIWLATGIPILPVRPWIFGHITTLGFYMGGALALLCVLRVLSRWVSSARTGRRRLEIRPELVRHFGVRTVLAALLFLICLELTLTVYTTIKQAIPLINGARFDAELIVLDRWLHFGLDPAWDLAALNLPSAFLWLMDLCYYTFWFVSKPLFFAILLTHPNVAKQQRYLAAYLGLWIVGVSLGVAFPSSGPFLIDPDSFPAGGAMPIAKLAQDFLAANFHGLEAITLEGLGGLTFGSGLMALPSHHVTVCILYVAFFWNEGLMARALSLAFLALIFVGSLLTGWHYAVDAYAGIPIIAVVLWAVRKAETARNAKIRSSSDDRARIPST